MEWELSKDAEIERENHERFRREREDERRKKWRKLEEEKQEFYQSKTKYKYIGFFFIFLLILNIISIFQFYVPLGGWHVLILVITLLLMAVFFVIGFERHSDDVGEY